MAAMTFMELIQAVQRDLDDRKERQFKVAEIKGWLREGHRMVWAAILQTDEGYGSTESDVTYPAATRHSPLVTLLGTSLAVYKINSIADVTGISGSDPGVSLDPITYLEHLDYGQEDDRYGRRSDGYRRAYYLYGTPMRIGLVPVPSSAITLRVLWTPSLTQMTDLDDTPDGVPEELHDAIVAHAVRLAKMRIGEPDTDQEQRIAGLTAVMGQSADRRQRQESRRVRIIDRHEQRYTGLRGTTYY